MKPPKATLTAPNFQMSAARPTLSLSRKTPLKSKKSGSSSSSGKKKTAVTSSTSAAAPKPWVDTVQDLNAYRPSKEELETKKAQRKSQNKVLAKVNGFRKKKQMKYYTNHINLVSGVFVRQKVSAFGSGETTIDPATSHA